MKLRWLLGLMVSLYSCSLVRGEDHFLTIGGGSSTTSSFVYQRSATVVWPPSGIALNALDARL